MKSLSPVILLCLFVLAWGVAAQSEVPTLTPPTPVPVPDPGFDDALLSESALARIVESGELQVGILYNEAPYGELTIRGEVAGYDADLARAIGEAWSVDVVFRQVTRQNRLDLLRAGEVDVLMAAIVHRRELDAQFDFSHTYRVGRQVIMTRADDPAVALINMANRRIGFVLGTEDEQALAGWRAQSNVPMEGVTFLTLDQAVVALYENEVDGVAARSERLQVLVANQPDAVKFLDETVQSEPYAIAMRRGDRPLRQHLNRTLQWLVAEGRLATLHAQYFPGEEFPQDVIPLWRGADETLPELSGLDVSIRYPAQYIIPSLQNQRVLRVAGLVEPLSGASESERRVYEVNRRLIETLATRWGVSIEVVPGDSLALLQAGQAHIVVGLEPDWGRAGIVDHSLPYLLNGDRLMIETNTRFSGFNDLRGRWVGIMSNDEGAAARAEGWANSINARIRIYTTSERDAADALLVSNNADVIYGNSLKLIAHLEANPNTLGLTERWYSRQYLVLAVPANDIDFRLLVDYSLQELTRDGTLESLLAPITPPGSEPPSFDYWPGARSYLGFVLGS